MQGEWQGRGAKLLGLRGNVTRGQFEAVCEGLHPETGEFLRSRHGVNRLSNDGSEQSKALSLRSDLFRTQVSFDSGNGRRRRAPNRRS